MQKCLLFASSSLFLNDMPFIDDHRTFVVLVSIQIVFVFVSPYETDDIEFGKHLIKHGDGVKDIAFAVEDLDVIVKGARERGAIILRDIWEESDENGSVRFATIQTVRHSNCLFNLNNELF